ncbi:polyamine aminopropyltransferase [Aliikangiella sp. IMCC44632]
MNVNPPNRRWLLIRHDIALMGIMMVLAACGLIYEYLLSHYAGRVLGIMETTIYTMIGIMIVAMGLGAWCAKWLKDPFSAFAWLECLVALLGVTATLFIASIIALTGLLPELLADSFNLPPDVVLKGGIIEQLQYYSRFLPFIMGFLLGLFIGMEIPLIARVREAVYGQHLENNVGTIYGADYIGAGLGAFVWVSLMLSLEITTAAVLTALLNVIAGSLFLFIYWSKIANRKILVAVHLFLLVVLGIVADSGARWMSEFANVLYRDQVIYQDNTQYQNITFTQRTFGQTNSVLDMYLNGRLQFSSQDEAIYHAMLTYPALMASARQNKVLIIGGGDGLALRDVLRWNPQQVHLIDLDPGLVSLFSNRYALDSSVSTEVLRKRLMALNNASFEDPRVEVIFGDAFIEVEKLLESQLKFDTVIIDLPDPSHPDLNKLYSDYFYARIKQLLSADGALVVQSTSPYHAKNAFQSIGKTVKTAGFSQVEQYRQNVPSFGEWGWTIATLAGKAPSHRIREFERLPYPSRYLTIDLLNGAFAFPADFYAQLEEINTNYLGSGVVYQYHTQAWQRDVGVYSAAKK